MARKTPTELGDALLAHLARRPSTAAEACRQLAISQSRFSRLAADMSSEVLRLGRARATRYLRRRAWPALGISQVLYEVEASGSVRAAAVLHGAGERGIWVDPRIAEVDARLYDGLPYFLHDLRPAGFLGRHVSRRHPHLALPDDVRLWTADHCVAYFADPAGARLPGAWLLGERALEQHRADARDAPDAVPDAARASRYAELAADAIATGPAGSSAGGEQPKFCVTVMPQRRAAIVKFSPAGDDAAAERWRDLLISEHLALAAMRASARPAACSHLVESGGRVCLEVERFDRLATGGRRGVLSLHALDCEYVGSLRSWRATADALLGQGRLGDGAHDAICWQALFGALIANDDMHLGNASVFASGTQPADATPGYDMLPAAYAPRHGQLVTPAWTPPSRGPHDARHWRSACAAAAAFWDAVAADTRVSRPFRAVAAGHAAAIHAARA